MKRAVPLGAAVAFAAALSIHLVTAGGVSARSGRAAMTHARGAPRGSVVEGRRLRVAGRLLALPVAANAPLLGSFAAVAVPSRNGDFLAYNTWNWVKPIDWQASLGSQGIQTGDTLGTPTLRIRDVREGIDRSLEPGTFSAAWRSDGALAYVRGVASAYRANTPYLRDVVVRSSPDADPTTWSTSPGRFVVVGWAKRSLIVSEQIPGGSPNLIALAGPGDSRPLANAAEPLGISPDGSTVLVTESYADTSVPAVREVTVRDGTEIARLPFSAIVDPVTKAAVTWVEGPGHWLRDHVVASASPGLVVLRTNGRELAIDQVIHLDSATRPNGMLFEPRFLGDDLRTIAAWSDVEFGSETAQIVCDRFALTCKQGAPLPTSRAPRPIFDQSGGDQ
jgi:hypothetical protein